MRIQKAPLHFMEYESAAGLVYEKKSCVLKLYYACRVQARRVTCCVMEPERGVSILFGKKYALFATTMLIQKL